MRGILDFRGKVIIDLIPKRRGLVHERILIKSKSMLGRSKSVTLSSLISMICKKGGNNDVLIFVEIRCKGYLSHAFQV